jgi:hypothetical protein
MVIFRCVGYFFNFHMPEGFCFPAFFCHFFHVVTLCMFPFVFFLCCFPSLILLFLACVFVCLLFLCCLSVVSRGWSQVILVSTHPNSLITALLRRGLRTPIMGRAVLAGGYAQGSATHRRHTKQLGVRWSEFRGPQAGSCT